MNGAEWLLFRLKAPSAGGGVSGSAGAGNLEARCFTALHPIVACSKEGYTSVLSGAFVAPQVVTRSGGDDNLVNSLAKARRVQSILTTEMEAIKKGNTRHYAAFVSPSRNTRELLRPFV
jgi:hypothetical protein